MNHLVRKLGVFKLVLIVLIALTVWIGIGCEQWEISGHIVDLDSKSTEGNFAYVIKEGEAFVKKYPDQHRGWNMLGWAYLKTDKIEDAKRCFEKSISIKPTWDNAYVGLGAVYRAKGQLDQAVNSYLKSIEIEPENPEAYSSLLVIEVMRSNGEKAVEYGEKAWALRKNHPSIPANLAFAYRLTNNHQKIMEYYEHAKRLKYYDMPALDKLVKTSAAEAANKKGNAVKSKAADTQPNPSK